MEGIKNLQIFFCSGIFLTLVLLLWDKIITAIRPIVENILFKAIFITAYAYAYLSIFFEKNYKHLYIFFVGEEIILRDAVVGKITENTYFEPIYMDNNYYAVVDSQKITNFWVEVIEGPVNINIFVHRDVKNFYEGMKTSIQCRKYWHNDILCFEKFI